LKQVSLTIANNERLGILGRNGAGKSTLMRLLAGELRAQQGETIAAADLKIGFFAQMELEQLTASATPLEELGTRGGDSVAQWTVQQKRDHLGRFGFSGDRVFAPSATFSGGERARLTLAILVARRPNMLLLDEPTNHLDLEMRDSLLLALQSFKGAVIVVAHDRALLRGICDRFLIVEGGGVHDFDGDLEDYAARLARGSENSAIGSLDRREQRRREAEARNRLTPLRRKLRELEQQLEKTTVQLNAFDAQLADGEYCAKLRLEEYARLAQKRQLAQAQVAEIENDWLAISEQLERLTYPTAE
jgi:ATP-binding cassette subfamily F protein 3